VSDAEPTLADTGFTPEATDPISRTRALVFAACLDVDPARPSPRAHRSDGPTAP